MKTLLGKASLNMATHDCTAKLPYHASHVDTATRHTSPLPLVPRISRSLRHWHRRRTWLLRDYQQSPVSGWKKITGTLGTDYRDYLVEYLAHGIRGNADLCAYFFLQASQLVRLKGQCGILATNTIAQGDTREVGLDQILASGWTIPRAVPSRKWPGEASLEVAHIWLRHGNWHSPYILNDLPVTGITAFLTSANIVQGNPYRLVANANKSFIGSFVLGMGFVLEPDEANRTYRKRLT